MKRIGITIFVFLFTSTDTFCQSPRISTPVTYNDWITFVTNFKNNPQLKNSPGGVDLVIDTQKENNFSRVYWRIFNGGEVQAVDKLQSVYKNQLILDKHYKLDAATCDYNLVGEYDFQDINSYFSTDHLDYAVTKAHNEALEFYGWFPIMEEMHAGVWPGSQFSQDHPEYLSVDQNDNTWLGRLSYSFPEVREYKAEVIFDYVNSYNFDGVFLDLARMGTREFSKDFCPNGGLCQSFKDFYRDANRNCSLGWDSWAIQEYVIEHGVQPVNDHPDWIQWRADYYTDFLELLNSKLNVLDKEIPIIVMLPMKSGDISRKEDLYDWNSWIEGDLIDGISFLINTDFCHDNDYITLPDSYKEISEELLNLKSEVNSLQNGENISIIASIDTRHLDKDEFSLVYGETIEGQVNETIWWESHWLKEFNHHGINPKYYLDLANSYSTVELLSQVTLDDQVINSGVNDISFIASANNLAFNDLIVNNESNLFAVTHNEMVFTGEFTVDGGSEFLAQINDLTFNSISSARSAENQEGTPKHPMDSSQIAGFTIYPNPSNGILKFGYDKNQIQIYRIEVLTADGRMLEHINTLIQDQIDISNFIDSSEHFLIINVLTSKGKKVFRVIRN